MGVKINALVIKLKIDFLFLLTSLSKPIQGSKSDHKHMGLARFLLADHSFTQAFNN